MNTVKPQIIVASHKENLWWVPKLRELDYEIVVYNTGSHGAFSFFLDENAEMSGLTKIEHIKLPNSDREAGQFLYHLSADKGNLSEYMLFLQADLGWSCSNHEKHLLGASEDAFNKLVLWLEESSTCRADFLSYGHTRPEYRQSNQHDEDIFKDIMQPLGATQCPYATVVGTNGGQFRVSKNKILSLPKEYINGLLKISESNPLAHRLEWSWGLVLDASKAAFTVLTHNPEDTKNENTVPETTRVC